jgi:acyl-CoA thioester hydrolase
VISPPPYKLWLFARRKAMKKIEFELPIYTYQIDFAGHVSNIVYVQWMEMGRQKLLDAVGLPIDQIAEDGIVPILVSTEIVYKVPLYLGDRVRVEMWLSELRRASARMEHRFYRDGDILAASGSQKGLFVHRESMRPHRMSSATRAAFEPYLWDETK